MQKPTNAELAILRVLWAAGPSTVRAVHEALETSGYTTTLKFMQIMYKKGLVTRNSDAKAHVYTAAISEADAEQGVMQDFLNRNFQGSAQKLVLSALSMKSSTPEELAEIKRLIEKLEKDQ